MLFGLVKEILVPKELMFLTHSLLENREDIQILTMVKKTTVQSSFI